MQPIHSIEFELTTEMATKVQETLVRWELRRGWKRDLPQLSNGGQILIPDSHRVPELKAFLRGKAEQVMAPVWQG